jgi:hypothetical protein
MFDLVLWFFAIALAPVIVDLAWRLVSEAAHRIAGAQGTALDDVTDWAAAASRPAPGRSWVPTRTGSY